MTVSKFTPADIQLNAIDDIKEQVTNIVLANLRYDELLKLIDWFQESGRMYPDSASPSIKAASTVALYAHYVGNREQSVSTPLCSRFWAGPTILRVLAFNIRELALA